MKTNNNFLFLFVIYLFLSSTLNAQTFGFKHDGFDRTYLLHLPIKYDKTKATPLVIAMHGGFGSSENIQDQSQLSVKSDQENFIVVYPQGLKLGALKISSWNAGTCCGQASRQNINDVGFLDQMLDTIIKKYNIDTNRIYATGMSNGGYMSYRLACELPHRIAAIAPVSASMTFAQCNPARPMPTIHFHSYLDSSVPYAGGIGNGPSAHYSPPLDSIFNVWSQLNQCQITNDTIINNNQYTFVKWTNCKCNADIQYYITRDGGHSWHGGKKTVIGDKASTYINANDLMWEFFKKHSLKCDNSSSIKKEITDLINIYPNPSQGKFSIQSSFKKYKINIYNHLGKLILQTQNAKNIDLSKNKAGFYICVIESKAKIYYQKLILNP